MPNVRKSSYSKTNEYTFNRQYRPLSKSEINLRYPNSDERGPFMLTDLTSPVSRPNQQFEWKGITPPKNRSWRYGKEALERLEKEGRIYSSEKGLPKLKAYLDENAGVEIGSVWDDIPPLSPAARENIKYPSQKPLALLKRIIQMGSNTNDVILDLFFGSGTALAAAQELDRKWIGCDLSEESVSVSTKRISEAFRLRPNADFTIGNGQTLKDVPIAYSLYSPVITGLEDFASIAGKRFVLNQPAPIEEIRHFELKEIKGARPVESIVNAADEYAVAFLNSEGGCVFWGIRNEDRWSVGVHLLYVERDRLRRLASNKLNDIKPKIDPTQYRIELHQVYDTDGKIMPDMWVVELKVPRPIFPGPYFTGSNELFAKVDGVKQKLEGPALAEWIMRRQRST
jgi:DNA methylase/Schlafen, AlbA_2